MSERLFNGEQIGVDSCAIYISTVAKARLRSRARLKCTGARRNAGITRSPFHLPMRKLFATMILASALAANADDSSVRAIQSGWFSNTTPLFDHGIYGQRQVIAILDTGLDWDSCYFAESDGSPPPINTGSPQNGLNSSNVDTSRRKVIAYDFLYSCDQFPGAPDCDDPNDVHDYDNALHGTHRRGGRGRRSGRRLVHDDPAEGIAPGAKLIVQDGGYIGGDNCSQRPGFGCPVKMTPILEQAYKQGARIHSNSWGDRQSTPPSLPAPTGNYSAAARDVDAFVFVASRHAARLRHRQRRPQHAAAGQLRPRARLREKRHAGRRHALHQSACIRRRRDAVLVHRSDARRPHQARPRRAVVRAHRQQRRRRVDEDVHLRRPSRERRGPRRRWPARRRWCGSTTPTVSIRPAWPRRRTRSSPAPRC